jgi:hypothetical protein
MIRSDLVRPLIGDGTMRFSRFSSATWRQG